MQSKLDSFIESWINVIVGFGISVIANFVIFPWVGVSASTGQILWIGLGMTVISVARSYIIRRFANKHLAKIRVKIVGFLRKEIK